MYKHTQTYANRLSKRDEYKLPYPYRILKIKKKYETMHKNSIGSCLNVNLATASTSTFTTTTGLTAANTNQMQPMDTGTAGVQSLSFVVDNWRKPSAIQPSMKLPREDMLLVKRFAKPCERSLYTDELKLVRIQVFNAF
jgi:hypothetical protein